MGMVFCELGMVLLVCFLPFHVMSFLQHDKDVGKGLRSFSWSLLLPKKMNYGAMNLIKASGRDGLSTKPDNMKHPISNLLNLLSAN